MSDHVVTSPRSAAFRVFGTVGAAIVALAVAAAVVRPDMMMSALHAVMGMIR